MGTKTRASGSGTWPTLLPSLNFTIIALNCAGCLVPMITVVIGKIFHGVFVLGRSYYSGSGWYNDDGLSIYGVVVISGPYPPDSTVYGYPHNNY